MGHCSAPPLTQSAPTSLVAPRPLVSPALLYWLSLCWPYVWHRPSQSPSALEHGQHILVERPLLNGNRNLPSSQSASFFGSPVPSILSTSTFSPLCIFSTTSFRSPMRTSVWRI